MSDIRYQKIKNQSMAYRKNAMIYFGHHKCATQYICGVIKSLCKILGLLFNQTHFSADKLPYNYHLKSPWNKKVYSVPIPTLESGIDFMGYTNASDKILECLKSIDHKGFHVIRDPRDIVVSGYFSHKYSHPIDKAPWIAEHREEGMLLELDYCSLYFERLATWNFEIPHIYETTYEKLIKNPYNEFCNIFTFLGIQILTFNPLVLGNDVTRIFFKKYLGIYIRKKYCVSAFNLKRILNRHEFTKKAKRPKGEEDPKSHYRKGIAGDWKNYFIPKLKSAFKERWGELLIKLGYEKDFEW